MSESFYGQTCNGPDGRIDALRKGNTRSSADRVFRDGLCQKAAAFPPRLTRPALIKPITKNSTERLVTHRGSEIGPTIPGAAPRCITKRSASLRFEQMQLPLWERLRFCCEKQLRIAAQRLVELGDSFS